MIYIYTIYYTIYILYIIILPRKKWKLLPGPFMILLKWKYKPTW